MPSSAARSKMGEAGSCASRMFTPPSITSSRLRRRSRSLIHSAIVTARENAGLRLGPCSPRQFEDRFATYVVDADQVDRAVATLNGCALLAQYGVGARLLLVGR